MMPHDENLAQIRPVLDLPLEQAAPVERFQNATLRPILKMLHEALNARLQHYFDKRSVPFEAFSLSKKRSAIDKSVRSDQHFRHSLTGMVIGHFTAVELAFFLEHEQELMRRISSMMVQRLQSPYAEVQP